jgi:hypothetical protein
MKKSLTGTVIEVKQIDIDSGYRMNGDSCAITRAARRTTGLTIATSKIDLQVKRRGRVTERYNLPRIAMEFISAFDLGIGGKPFKFRIGRRVA